jgi:hypothetical protein
MGLHFGGFADIDGYYSNAPLLIRIINVVGTSDAVHRQVAFALQLAAACRRDRPDIDMAKFFHCTAAENGRRE